MQLVKMVVVAPKDLVLDLLHRGERCIMNMKKERERSRRDLTG